MIACAPRPVWLAGRAEPDVGPADAAIAFPPAGCDPAGAVALAAKAGAREIGCWALAPDDALGRRLLGLGFQDGWQPQWIGIEPRPADERPAADESPDCGDGLPNASAAHRAAVREPGVHHFVVRNGGTLVGHAVLNVAGTTAGVYDMGVGLEHRRRGHGLATGDGEPMYRRAGFASLGLGMTWWMFPDAARP